MTVSGEESVPRSMQAIWQEITALTDAYCRDHLTEEYAVLCRRLVATLARKRPSPLAGGRVQSWACGVVYMLVGDNFLFDPKEEHSTSAGDLCAAFGLSKTTGSKWARTIRDAVRAQPYDPKWTVPSRLALHPYAWFISVNGLIVDARYAPRRVQEDAFRAGLIPFLPETSG